MKLYSLEICRKTHYDMDSSLKASASFKGPGGEITVELAPSFIAQVLKMVEADAIERARRLGKAVDSAMSDAVGEAKALETDSTPLQIPEEF